MSEYQYFYFESIDKPLTTRQQSDLRRISSRAEIDSRRFVNEYHFGDFRGKPLDMMKKYFDAYLHYACWATRVLMLKIPVSCLDMRTAKKYCTEETFKIVKHGSNAILCFQLWEEEGDGWWDEEPKLLQLISLRDDLMSGDFRSLYIAWLAQYRHEKKPTKSPPIPPGLQKPTETLRLFADFLYLDEKTFKEAGKISGGEAPKQPTEKELRLWVEKLPAKMLRNIVSNMLTEKESPQAIRRALLNRYIAEAKRKKK